MLFARLRTSVVVLCLASASSSSFGIEGAEPRLVVEEKSLGEARPDTSDGSFTSTADGKRYAYMACSSSILRGMVNSLTLGRGMNAGKCEVVVDGEVFGPYGGAMRPTFSADGKRFVFAAMPITRYRDETFMLVVDGEEGEEVEGIVGPPVFSADGKRIAHAADAEGARVFVDGIQSQRWKYVYTDQVFFCGKNNSVVYAAKTDDGWAVVEEGEVQADTLADDIHRVNCLNDGTILYTMRRNKEHFAVVGGEVQGPYEDARWMEVSSDGSHYSYVAKLGKKREVVVVDGVPGVEYEEVKGTVMGPGGQIAFLAKNKKLTFVVDGRETGEWKDIAGGLFSASGEHFAFVAKQKKQLVLWRDGVIKPLDADVVFLDFSPNGLSLLAVLESKDDLRVVIDGSESDGFPKKEGHIGMPPKWIDDSVAVAYARKGNQIVRRTFRLEH